MNLLFICVCLTGIIGTLHAFVVFGVDELGRTFVAEPSPYATVRDLRAEIASILQVSEHEMVVSFQGKQLLDLDAMLADIGLSNEVMVCVSPIKPVIALQFVHECWSVAKVSGANPDVLEWDTAKDITQFGWLHEMGWVVIKFIDEHKMEHTQIVYKAQYLLETVTTLSHLFFVIADHRIRTHSVPTEQISTEEMHFEPGDLQRAEYAKDLLLTPLDGQHMVLSYEYLNGGEGYYRFPPGYSVLLRHRNSTQL